MIETTTDNRTTTTRRPLIAGVLRKSFAQPGLASERPTAFSQAERREVIDAVRDGRDVRERVIDDIVDKLLDELTW